jgi:hypothetical protein
MPCRATLAQVGILYLVRHDLHVTALQALEHSASS